MRIMNEVLIGLGLSLGIMGCVDAPGPIDTDEGERTATLALNVSMSGGNDVEKMRFEVTRCHTGLKWTETRKLEDMYLPGGIPSFEGEPYDEDSTHLFADQYFLLKAGCYNVKVTPLDKWGRRSDDCFAAHAWGERVYDGETTEVLLISQCQGPARGGLDVIGTLNNPPVIDDLTFDPSKFVTDCEGTKVCVTVSDPDNDPLEIVWKKLSGPHTPTPHIIRTRVNQDGSITQCAKIKPRKKGDLEYAVKVYDRAYDEYGKLTRIESLLAAQGDPNPSRDSIKFPIYSGVTCGHYYP